MADKADGGSAVDPAREQRVNVLAGALEQLEQSIALAEFVGTPRRRVRTLRHTAGSVRSMLRQAADDAFGPVPADIAAMSADELYEALKDEPAASGA